MCPVESILHQLWQIYESHGTLLPTLDFRVTLHFLCWASQASKGTLVWTFSKSRRWQLKEPFSIPLNHLNLDDYHWQSVSHLAERKKNDLLHEPMIAPIGLQIFSSIPTRIPRWRISVMTTSGPLVMSLTSKTRVGSTFLNTHQDEDPILWTPTFIHVGNSLFLSNFQVDWWWEIASSG